MPARSITLMSGLVVIASTQRALTRFTTRNASRAILRWTSETSLRRMACQVISCLPPNRSTRASFSSTSTSTTSGNSAPGAMISTERSDSSWS